MTDTAVQVNGAAAISPAILEKVVIGGDLSGLSPADRVRYYSEVCRSLGLNPLTKPFAYITLNGKMVLYALRDCTDQLRKVNKVSIGGLVRERHEDVYVVTARATTPDGRTDESIGAVSIVGLKGEALANAMMKAETKSKRRVTLSIVGLGMLDETEVETIPTARIEAVDTTTGEMTQSEKDWRHRSATGTDIRRDDYAIQPQSSAPPPIAPKEVGEAGLPIEAPPSSDAITPKQLSTIYVIGRREHRLSDPETDEMCVNVFGVRPSELTKAQASTFITNMQTRAQA